MKTNLQLLVITLLFASNVFSQAGSTCWRMVSAGENFTLGIKTDGTLWGWGQNGNLLGLNGNMANQNLPVQIGLANDWSTVSAGTVHSLAVKTNGTLWAWGNGQFGQLGNGAFNNATWTVTQMGTATDWQTVSAGNRFSLAIKNTGTLWSWGLNNLGQLGINNLVDQNLPVQIGTASNWFKIDAGNQHSLAIDNAGFIYAFGNNAFGQLGTGNFTTSLVPIVISTSNNWAEVSAGLDHSMALDAGGILFTFGNNNNGQLADGTNTLSNVMIPISFVSPGIVNQYIAISAGGGHSLAIDTNNGLFSSGLNTQGQLGLGNNTSVNILNQVGSSNNWMSISAGTVHSLAMDTSTSLYSTGRGQEGELGIGSFVPMNTLQAVGCPNSTLAIQTVSLDKTSISVYPNPTNSEINIEYTIENSGKITIQVTNIQGQVIKQMKLERNSGIQRESIDLSNQASGMYFITLTTDETSHTTKVVKN